jgi:hypothetical protein
MATVQLVDIYEPDTFQEMADEAAIELNAFVASGIIVESEKLTAMAQAGGRTGEMPSYQPLDASGEPDIMNDDPAIKAVPDKIESAIQRWRLAKLHKAWSIMSFSRDLALIDPVTAITSKIGKYWATIEERRVINAAMGVLADNVANDASDMVYSIATDDAGAITAAEQISATAVITAQQTAGDRQGMFTAIAMHSAVYSRLKILNLIEFIPDSRGEVEIPTYQRMRVVVDDSCPAVAGVNRITYTTIMFSPGFISRGQGRPELANEISRYADVGNGAGETVYHTRRNQILHPWGFDFTSAALTGVYSPNLADLSNALNWDRKFARKNCGVCFLQTNG